MGFPSVLEGWDLPNPAVLGPSLYDHPSLAPRLMEDPRFRKYLVFALCTYDMFKTAYGGAGSWYAGIDTDEWHATSPCAKDIDFLIYDKLRWNHDKIRSSFLDPIRNVESHGLEPYCSI